MVSRKNGKKTDQELTAYHEAGHAVVSWALRVPIKSVTIDWDKVSADLIEKSKQRHRGRPRGQLYQSDMPVTIGSLILREPRALAKAKKHLAVHRAGVYAEMKVQRIAFTTKNLQLFTDIYDELKSGQGEILLAQAHVSVPSVEKQARILIERHWPAVKALAAVLLEKHTMSGQAVRKLLRECSKGRL